MIELEDLNKLKVAELRAELQTRGLDSKGVKAVLVDRLREAVEAEIEDRNSSPENDKAVETREFKERDAIGGNVTEEPLQERNDDDSKYEEDEENSGYEGEPMFSDKTDENKKLNPDNYETHCEKIPQKAMEDLIKQDKEDLAKKSFYEEGPTEDLADVKQEDEKSAPTSTRDMGVKQEASENESSDMKMETEHGEERRGRKRQYSGSGQEDYKRSRPDVEEVRVEDEPEFDKSIFALDWYNSDLSLLIDKDTRLKATPMVVGGFAYVWHGVRATYGAMNGRVCFEVGVEENLNIGSIEEEEEHPFVVRCGWSVDDAHLTLGEDQLSWGYGGTGKASTDLKFKDYGKAFGKGDVIGCFLDLESEPITMSFTVNGEHQGVCYEVTREEVGNRPIFPHILTKNCSFKVNFGSEDPWFETLSEYTFIEKIPLEQLTAGTQGPEKREDSEVIMMVGLPAAGKSTWAQQYCKDHPEKKYNVLGTNDLIDRMKVMGLPRKRNYSGRWENLIDKCTRCLNKLLHLATKRRRNYIIDQTNVYPSAQKRKIKGFVGCKRRAVVIFPSDEELKSRTEKREKEEGKDVPDKAVLEMKANFKLPEVGEFFEEVDFIELQQEEALELLKQYNREGEKAGFGPKNFHSGNQQGRRLGYVDRRGKYNNRGGYRGSWDRDRDRRGGFDRRDRGGWNRDRDRDRTNYRDNRSGGFNKDRNYRGSGGGGWQSGYKGGNQNRQGGGNSWSTNQGGQDYSNWGTQNYGNQAWGGQGYGTGYNWNQQYYGQPQQQQQQYWGQGYGTQAGYNTQAYAAQGSYGQSGYGYGNQQVGQQWGGAYGSNYTTTAATPTTGYSTQSSAASNTSTTTTQQYSRK